MINCTDILNKAGMSRLFLMKLCKERVCSGAFASEELTDCFSCLCTVTVSANVKFMSKCGIGVFLISDSRL